MLEKIICLINLLPNVFKIFEYFVTDSMVQASSLIFGVFFSFPSTDDLLTVLDEQIYNSFDISAIAPGLAKAFDKV